MGDQKAVGGSIWPTMGTMAIAAMLGTNFLIGPGTGIKPANERAPIVVGSQAVPSDAVHELNHQLRIRSPLYDFAGIEPPVIIDEPKKPIQIPTSTDEPCANISEVRKPLGTDEATTDKGSIDDSLKKVLSKFTLQFLIVTVADPIDSENSYFFDHQLDAIQKALVANQKDVWSYSGSYLPWQAFKDQRTAEVKFPLKRHQHWYQDEPGVLLFRRKEPSRPAKKLDGSAKKVDGAATEVDEAEKEGRLLLIYLVGESSTLGIHRGALMRAIREITDLDGISSKSDQSTPRANSRPIRIIGPTFTGSAVSLDQSLKQAHALNSAITSHVINGSATAVPDDCFNTPDVVYIGRTVCNSVETFSALNLAAGKAPRENTEAGKKANNHRIVWLTETGTAFSTAAVGVFDKEDVVIPVPLGISRVRADFERSLIAARQQPTGLRLFNSTSQLPFDADDIARDVPPIQTPQMTSPAVELLLSQIMRAVTQKSVSYVGIVATDVRDTIFLSEMVKLRCPHVQLLLASPDVLLTHPSYSESLRGAIVASSYPLFTEGLLACQNPAAATHSLPVMSGQTPIGIYNAVLLQLDLDHREIERRNKKLPDDSSPFSGGDGQNIRVVRTSSPLPLAGMLSDGKTASPYLWLHSIGYDRFHARKLVPHRKETHFLIHVQSDESDEPSVLQYRPGWSWNAFQLSLIAIVGIAFFMTSRKRCDDQDWPENCDSLLMPLRHFSRYRQKTRNWIVRISLFFLTTVMLVSGYVLYVAPFSNSLENLRWLEEMHFFSGVTLLLPFVCASAAVVSMSYIKIRQSYLVSEERIIRRGPKDQVPKKWTELWIVSFRELSQYPGRGWLALGAICLVWNLAATCYYTIDTYGEPLSFWSVFATIVLGYGLWWLAALELLSFQWQLRQKAKSLQREPDRLDKVFLSELHDEGLHGLHRVMFGAGPNQKDLIALRRSQYRNTDRTHVEFREIQYRLVIIRNQFWLLGMGSLLLFGAVVSYPFSSAFMLRSFATLTVMTLVGGVCLCFWKLETDENLSTILGTNPNEMEWNLQNISVFAIYGLVAVIVLLAQFVPGSWVALGRLVEPFVHLGH